MSAVSLSNSSSLLSPAWHLKTSDAGFYAGFVALLSAKRETSQEVDGVVAEILHNIRTKGDDALINYCRAFDHVDFSTEPMLVSAAEKAEAITQCAPAALQALEFAAERIRAYHLRQKPQDVSFEDEAGVKLGWRWSALASVGLYVPGGLAAYPSSVLMNAIPAQIAGVERLVMVVPSPRGKIASPLVLAAASMLGIDEIYKIGGAQAIGALAYGTKTIPPVVKIVGPGNAYVAAAKRQVFGQVGIDMVAGPSEVVIIADKNANPAFIAADLLAQAEHDKAAQSILITDDAALAEAVMLHLTQQLEKLSRRAIALESWQKNGAIIVTHDLMEAVGLANRLAPEHLEIMTASAHRLASHIRDAGAIFLGEYTPEAIGDYVGGSNHVLPTARSARFSSGLGVLDFMKRTSLLECSPTALRQLAPHAITLGEAEGLGAHAFSVALRLMDQGGVR